MTCEVSLPAQFRVLAQLYCVPGGRAEEAATQDMLHCEALQ